MYTGISIILNAHRENRWLISSLKSLDLARKELLNKKIKSEIILCLDSGNAKTKEIAKNNNQLYDLYYEVDFKNLGHARTYASSRSNFKYLAFLDADDLISSNWLIEAYKEAENSDDSLTTIFHTEHFVSFGKNLDKSQLFAIKNLDSNSENFDPLLLVAKWYYCNNIFFNKEIIKKFPIEPYNHDKGFGSEDWHWTCQTLTNNIQRRVIKNTIYYYRIKNKNLSLGSANGLVIKPNKLFKDSLYSEEFLKKNYPQNDIELKVEKNSQILVHALALLNFEYDIFEILKNYENYRFSTQNFCYASAKLYATLKLFNNNNSIPLIFLNLNKNNSLSKDLSSLIFRDQIIRSDEKKIYLIEGMGIDEDVYISRDRILIINVDKLRTLSFIDNICQTLSNYIVTNDVSLINYNSDLYEILSNNYYRVFHSNGITGIQCFFENIDDFDEGRWIRNYIESFYNNKIYASLLYCHNETDAEFLENIINVPKEIIKKETNGNPDFLKIINEKSLQKKNQLPENFVSDSDLVLLSLIVNLSNEGMLLIPSLNSIFNSINESSYARFIEIIIVCDVIDSPTQFALDIYFKSQPTEYKVNIKFLESSCRNLSQSRLLGLSSAYGKYISFLDGDDLISSNWIQESLNMINKNSFGFIYHPEIAMQFNHNGYLRHSLQPNVEKNDKERAIGIFYENFWTSLFICSREYVDTYFKEVLATNGNGFEDWSMHINSIGKSVSHIVVPQTIHFVRVKNNSLSIEMHANNLLPLLEDNFLITK